MLWRGTSSSAFPLPLLLNAVQVRLDQDDKFRLNLGNEFANGIRGIVLPTSPELESFKDGQGNPSCGTVSK